MQLPCEGSGIEYGLVFARLPRSKSLTCINTPNWQGTPTVAQEITQEREAQGIQENEDKEPEEPWSGVSTAPIDRACRQGLSTGPVDRAGRQGGRQGTPKLASFYIDFLHGK